jgi:hypothetical protein
MIAFQRPSCLVWLVSFVVHFPCDPNKLVWLTTTHQKNTHEVYEAHHSQIIMSHIQRSHVAAVNTLNALQPIFKDDQDVQNVLSI